MKVLTRAFGEVEVSEKQRIKIKDGLLGFEDVTDYVLIDLNNNAPFYWLQAENIPEIAFVVIDPKNIVANYKLEVNPIDLEEIEVSNEDDALVFCIVTLSSLPNKTTVNLLGPIVINKKKRIAKQMISLNDSYSVRHPLVNEGGEQC